MTSAHDPSGRFFVWGDVQPMQTMECAKPRHPVLAMVFRAGACLVRTVLLPMQIIARMLGLAHAKATPLFAALVVIEATDMIFAVDSIPAVLSLTTDPFVAYTSNILAVLGLRALFFALVAAMTRMAYLGAALGAILVFIGCKLMLGMVDVHVSLEVTLVVVLGTLGAAGLLAVVRPRALPSRTESV